VSALLNVILLVDLSWRNCQPQIPGGQSDHSWTSADTDQ